MAHALGTVRIPEWFQGPTGSGQGGWTAKKFLDAIEPDLAGSAATFRLGRPIPIDSDMQVVREGDSWQLMHDSSVVMEATRWDGVFDSTTAVDPADAAETRSRFPLPGDLHPVPLCFSCGLQPDSMQIHAGPLPDGRYAIDWSVPTWAADTGQAAIDGALWAAMDCTSAWFANCSDGIREAFTVQYAAEVISPLRPDTSYALVSWSGSAKPGWDGRKRGASAAAFDVNGECVARAKSFWVATSDQPAPPQQPAAQ